MFPKPLEEFISEVIYAVRYCYPSIFPSWQSSKKPGMWHS